MKKTHFFSQGFTLVELLVVIVLIGALAIGLFATINPIEQINRGRDSGRRNIAREMAGAINRYYAARQVYPFSADIATEALSGTNVDAVITELVTAGELKSNFKSSSGNALDDVMMTVTGTGTAFQVCFEPTSTSVMNDPAAGFDDAGTAVAACTDGTPNTATDNCNICFN